MMSRKLIFENPAELEEKINEYFKTCDAGEDVEELTKRGDLIRYHRKIPYTIEGLALWLDISPRTIRNYGNRENFYPIISRTRDKIYNSWITNGLLDKYNCKMVALCLAANNTDYRVNSDQNLKVSISIEDAIRQIQERRQHQGRIQAPPEYDIIEMD